MPPLVEAIVLGVVQGLTEFIPVSSSGHLVLSKELLGLEPRSLAFDVALHVGTLGAVVVYFRAELLGIARGFLGTRGAGGGRRLGLLLVAGSVPVAVAGLALRDVVETAFATPAAAAGSLYVTAALLAGAELWRSHRVGRGGDRPGTPPSTDPPRAGADPDDPAGAGLDRLGLRHALTAGLGQCLALFPGVSRSGSTIAAGMVSGLTREAATRFSFMLAIPALVGAAALTLPDLARETRGADGVEIAAGVVAAFLSGYVAIRWLVALVARRGLYAFAVYCAVVATVALVLLSA